MRMGFEPVCGGGFCGDREGRAKASVTSAPDSRTTEEPRDYDLVLTSPGRAPGCVGLMGSGPGATAYVRWRRPATNLEAAACLVRVREAVEVSMVECECVGCGSDAESSRFKCGVLCCCLSRKARSSVDQRRVVSPFVVLPRPPVSPRHSSHDVLEDPRPLCRHWGKNTPCSDTSHLRKQTLSRQTEHERCTGITHICHE